MGAALRMISRRVCSPLRISLLQKMTATDWSLIALYQMLYETERFLIASKDRVSYERCRKFHFPSEYRCRATGHQSLAHRGRRYAHDIHGTARHGYSQCRLTAYCRRPRRQL